MNADHTLVRAFASGDGRPQAVDTNSLAKSLKTELLAVDAAAGKVRLAFAPGAEFLQGKGVVQGGIVGTMLDFAVAFAVLAKLPVERTAATASLSVNFLSAAQAGRFVAEASVDRLGGRLAYASAKLFRADDEQTPVATASGVMAVFDAR
jgi:uncharacterized protein (TIGR00369 family)